MRFIQAVGLFTLAICGVSAFAQPKVLTLEEAKQIALEKNENVAQAQNNVTAAQSGVLAAYGSYLPTLSASAGWTRQQSDQSASTKLISGQPFFLPASFSVLNNFSTGVSLGYNIFDGFARGARFGQATSNAVATEQISARTRQATVFQVESGYFTVLRNEQLVKVAEENLKRDNRQLERITESNRVGALSLADVYRQQSQVAADELALITAQNTYNKSIADLLSLVGLDVSEDYTIADASISSELTKPELDSAATFLSGFAALNQRALAARPDYISARENYDAATSGVTVARSNYFPSISAFAGYGVSNDELQRISANKSINWGLRLNWTLFDGFQTNQSLQTAVAQKRNAEISLVQTERNISVDVKKALLDLDAARKQYEASQKGLISATEDQKIAEERYNLGAGTLLDLLTANAGYVNAAVNKVTAVYNYFTAKANVLYVLGEKSY